MVKRRHKADKLKILVTWLCVSLFSRTATDYQDAVRANYTMVGLRVQAD